MPTDTRHDLQALRARARHHVRAAAELLGAAIEGLPEDHPGRYELEQAECDLEDVAVNLEPPAPTLRVVSSRGGS